MSVNDKAWNDPPIFKYEAVKHTPKRTLLNKRVPFPMSPKQDVEKSLLPPVFDASFLPPSASSSITFMTPDVINTENKKCEAAESEKMETKTSEKCNLSDEEMLTFIMSAFQKIISQVTDDSEERLQDIKSRMDILNSTWNEKLSYSVKEKMFQLTRELSSGNHDAADALHRCLIVDHINEVKQWMVGVKHIIQISREQRNSAKDVD